MWSKDTGAVTDLEQLKLTINATILCYMICTILRYGHAGGNMDDGELQKEVKCFVTVVNECSTSMRRGR